MSERRGASKLGCLVSLLLVAAISYFAVNVGEVYVRHLRYRDAMEQEARFAGTRDDLAIVRRLRSLADSLGLPAEAGRVKVRRTARRIVISAEYSEFVDWPFVRREIHFSPLVEGGL